MHVTLDKTLRRPKVHGERDGSPGTYTVLVTMPGYQLWSVGGVTARAGPCHVQTQTMQAALEPNP